MYQKTKKRAKSGQHRRLNYLQTIGELLGSIDNTGLCPLIVLKSDDLNKQVAIRELLEKE